MNQIQYRGHNDDGDTLIYKPCQATLMPSVNFHKREPHPLYFILMSYIIMTIIYITGMFFVAVSFDPQMNVSEAR